MSKIKEIIYVLKIITHNLKIVLKMASFLVKLELVIFMQSV